MNTEQLALQVLKKNPGKNFCLPCLGKAAGLSVYDRATSLQGLYETTWLKLVKEGVCSVCKKVSQVMKIDVV